MRSVRKRRRVCDGGRKRTGALDVVDVNCFDDKAFVGRHCARRNHRQDVRDADLGEMLAVGRRVHRAHVQVRTNEMRSVVGLLFVSVPPTGAGASQSRRHSSFQRALGGALLPTKNAKVEPLAQI